MGGAGWAWRAPGAAAPPVPPPARPPPAAPCRRPPPASLLPPSFCRGHDVFNALDILENAPFLQDLKFGPGDGQARGKGVGRGGRGRDKGALAPRLAPPHPRSPLPLPPTPPQLRYYLYNWRVAPPLGPGDVGLVLL